MNDDTDRELHALIHDDYDPRQDDRDWEARQDAVWDAEEAAAAWGNLDELPEVDDDGQAQLGLPW